MFCDFKKSADKVSP